MRPIVEPPDETPPDSLPPRNPVREKRLDAAARS